MPKRVLIVIGTRPEMIKTGPLVRAAAIEPRFDMRLCITAQHRELLDPLLDLFGIRVDYDLNIMRAGQDLYGVTTRILKGVGEVIRDCKPDCVIVHGDTTTTFASALAAFYEKVAVGHIEAGLRTGDLYAPWPEEANRKLVSGLTRYNFAPTNRARDNLLREGVPAEQVYVTGNTVIDTLFWVRDRIGADSALANSLVAEFPFLDAEKRMILVTAHRRENFGEGFENICKGLLEIARARPDVQIVYPVHPNPNVQSPVHSHLDGQPNIALIDPVEYLPFVFLMQKSYLIITDSGGIQEEAPSLGKPVLVMRDATERPEAVEAGTVRLVGTKRRKIVEETLRLIDDRAAYEEMSQVHNPYGDGRATVRIVEVLGRAN
jgi:UDP-N-acetylglucosamine 2-epimerase (non-hydrolysing)